jgi:hypothetical protein
MRRALRTAVAAGMMTVASLAAGRAGAQTVTVLSGPLGNPIHEGTPAFSVFATGFAAIELPLQLRLQIATRADFAGALLIDTLVTSSTSTTTYFIPHLLPENVTIFWRARATTATGKTVTSDVVGPRTTSPWLVLLAPNNKNGSTVAQRRPVFLWSSVYIRPPLKPWSYIVTITRSSDNVPLQTGTVVGDTVFTAFEDLESNTSYRWSVSAVSPSTGDSIKVQSSTFVIVDPKSPVATTLFQNFPNPFPTATVQATCIWFDLRAQSVVHLDVIDLHGNHVATILPGRGVGTTLPPGRYGRAEVGSDSGCDSRLTWDGTADNGRTVPPGVYLIRFRGDGKEYRRSMLWKGR